MADAFHLRNRPTAFAHNPAPAGFFVSGAIEDGQDWPCRSTKVPLNPLLFGPLLAPLLPILLGALLWGSTSPACGANRQVTLACDGRDDTTALNTALAATRPGDTLHLPAGTCRFSDNLRLNGKTDVEIAGAGRERTILLASDPERSALVISGSQHVRVRDLCLRGVTPPRTRIHHADARGIYVERSRDITLTNNRIEHTAGAGIALWRVSQALIAGNEVVDTLADGIHVTGGAADVRIEDNLAIRTGDDSFASIGYLSEQAAFGLNRHIVIRGNRSFGSMASGVAVEGSTDVSVAGNTIEDSGVAGIRIASVGSEFNTAAVDHVNVTDNTLRRVRTRADVDHAAIMVFADRAPVSEISIRGNRIDRANTREGIRVRGSVLPAWPTSRVSVRDNELHDPSGRLSVCVRVGAGAFDVEQNGNRLNAAICR